MARVRAIALEHNGFIAMSLLCCRATARTIEFRSPLAVLMPLPCYLLRTSIITILVASTCLLPHSTLAILPKMYAKAPITNLRFVFIAY